MSDETTSSVDRLSGAHLRALLRLAARPAGESRLAAEAGDPATLRDVLAELCAERGQSGEFVLATVCAADTPLPVLQSIKSLAKQLVAGAAGDARRAAATVLYHAAVAAGVAHHGTNLSSHELSARAPLYEDLAVALAADPLGSLFADAAIAIADMGDALR